jgi:hypothetical protein
MVERNPARARSAKYQQNKFVKMRVTPKVAPSKRSAKNRFAATSKRRFKTAHKNPKHRPSLSRKKARIFAKVAAKMKYASRCNEEFLSHEGLGEWGQFAKQELASGQYSGLLQNDKAFRRFCPGFKTMDQEQRQNVWVFILMSMSHYESSCRPSVSNRGPYGRAKGLLQLHEGSENRYVHWDRDRLCQKGDSRDPKGSIQCTLSMLNGQVEKTKSVFFEYSYWDVLRNVNKPRTHASKIRLALQMLPECKVRSVASSLDFDEESPQPTKAPQTSTLAQTQRPNRTKAL